LNQLFCLCRRYYKPLAYLSLLIVSGAFSHILTGEYSNDGGRLHVALSAKLLLASSYMISVMLIASFWQELKNKQVSLFWLWTLLVAWSFTTLVMGQLSASALMRLGGAIGCTLTGVMIYVCFKRIADFIEVIFWACLTVMIINLAHIDWHVLVSPSSENIKGVFVQKNLLGHISFLTMFISCYMFYEKSNWIRPISVISFLCALWLLLLSTSMTSNLLIPIAIYTASVTFVMSYYRKGTVVIVVLTTSLLSLLALKWKELFSLLGKSTTFTGRTNHWETYWKLIEQNLWTGHGYGAYPFSEPQTYWLTAGPHSGYVESLYYIGIIGLMLIFAIVLITLKNGWLCLKNKALVFETSFALSFLAVFLALNITETYMLNRSGLFWPLFVYISLHLAYLNKTKIEPS